MIDGQIHPIVAIIVSIVTAVVTFLTARQKYQSDTANTLSTLADASTTLLAPLTARVNELETQRVFDIKRISELEFKNDATRREVDTLTAIIVLRDEEITALKASRDERIQKLEASIRVRDELIKSLQADIESLRMQVVELQHHEEM